MTKDIQFVPRLIRSIDIVNSSRKIHQKSRFPIRNSICIYISLIPIVIIQTLSNFFSLKALVSKSVMKENCLFKSSSANSVQLNFFDAFSAASFVNFDDSNDACTWNCVNQEYEMKFEQCIILYMCRFLLAWSFLTISICFNNNCNSGCYLKYRE